MKIVAVIPARFASTRFPGKPLMDICGKPMIWWVYTEAIKVKEFSDVIVATDSTEIETVCKDFGITVMMTSGSHLSGTDRVAEVATKTNADYYVIILGDEPAMRAEDMCAVARVITSGVDADAIQLIEKMHNPVDVVNTSTVKMAINDDGYCVYLSRAPIPTPKFTVSYDYYKSCGLFAMSRDALNFFTTTKRGNLERIEDIEQLRLIENHKKLFTVTAKFESFSVDTPKDLKRVTLEMSKRIGSSRC